MKWEQVWMIASVLLLMAAAIFLWRNNLSVAFVTAALGACAWFLSYRAQIQNEIDVSTESEEPEVSCGSGSDGVREHNED
ncbi:MAG TPA: hypothetical protein VFU37_23570 [Pyrinomonadaceae bacterium]|nr:hypothetical protein [Pyrinomonadaceae bacterium]